MEVSTGSSVGVSDSGSVVSSSWFASSLAFSFHQLFSDTHIVKSINQGAVLQSMSKDYASITKAPVRACYGGS